MRRCEGRAGRAGAEGGRHWGMEGSCAFNSGGLQRHQQDVDKRYVKLYIQRDFLVSGSTWGPFSDLMSELRFLFDMEY